MPTDRMKKLISEKVSTWDQFKTSLTPGDVSVKERSLEDMALNKIKEEEKEAQLEAIRRKRMIAGG